MLFDLCQNLKIYVISIEAIAFSVVFASGARQFPGRVEVYEVYAPRFFEGIAAVATLLRNDN